MSTPQELSVNSPSATAHCREALTLLNEITPQIHRLTSPFINHADLNPTIVKIRDGLANVKTNLRGVQPDAGAAEIPGETYNAIEGEIATLNLLLNDLLGQL